MHMKGALQHTFYILDLRMPVRQCGGTFTHQIYTTGGQNAILVSSKFTGHVYETNQSAFLTASINMSMAVGNRRKDDMWEVRGLVKSYGIGKNRQEVLKGVNFSVGQGEFVAVMGSSGSGKTTLLDCISRYKPFEGGEVLLNGKDLGRLNEKEMAKVRRVYMLPTVIGCLMMLAWYPLLMWQNDGRFTSAELWAIRVEIDILGAVRPGGL